MLGAKAMRVIFWCMVCPAWMVAFLILRISSPSFKPGLQSEFMIIGMMGVALFWAFSVAGIAWLLCQAWNWLWTFLKEFFVALARPLR